MASHKLTRMPIRTECDAELDRAMAILDDIAADIGHAHASHAPGDETLLGRIAALRRCVDARRASASARRSS